MYKKLLVAIDVSERGIKALQQALALAEALGAQVLGLYVLPPGAAQAGGATLVSKSIEEKIKAKKALVAEEVLHKIEERLPGALSRLKFVTREGRNKAKTIVDFAEFEGCDLIVMGSRNLPGASSVIMRSVTSAVLSSGKKPVLVIR